MQTIERRTYAADLPVAITVHADGRVVYTIDTSDVAAVAATPADQDRLDAAVMTADGVIELPQVTMHPRSTVKGA